MSGVTFIVLVCGGRNYGLERANDPECEVHHYHMGDGHCTCGELTAKALRQRDTLKSILEDLHKRNTFTHLLHGGAHGADSLAGEWGKLRGVQTVVCSPGWDLYGNAAGFIRNKRMAELEPDLVVAFPGGRGTASMVQIAKERGLPVHEVIDG